jgi:hypothetical protein
VADIDGGFFISLEGFPVFDGIPDNKKVFQRESTTNEMFVSVQYVTNIFCETETDVVKYHPRREGYSSDLVIRDIAKRNPRACIIDTLNVPSWNINDYWAIATKYPNIQFLFAHSGGYDIIEFLKASDFLPNVWLDFSLTQHYFGWCGNKPRLSHVTDAIEWSFCSEKISKKILFGSDEPFFSRATALDMYLAKGLVEKMNVNFGTLLDKIFG